MKKFKILLAFLLSAFTILSVNITKAQESSFVKIKARQIINFPIKNLPLKIQLEYKLSGWIIADTGAYREVTLTNGEVYSHHTKYDLNESGLVQFRNASVGDKISTDHHSLRVAEIQEINGEKVAIFDVNMGELFDKMDSEHFKVVFKKGYGDKYYTGDWVHCNRFNGPATDDIHYPKSNPRAWINFAGSDCDLALLSSTVCWGHSYCNQSGPAGGCSIKIGRSPLYHRN